MSYAKRVREAAQRVAEVLRRLEVDERFLRFDGTVELPARIIAPTQADSKFQAEQALGDWAEDMVCQAVNESNTSIVSSHYGDNSKLFAQDEGFRDEYIRGIKDTFTYGKRADLLLLPRSASPPIDLTVLSERERSEFVAQSLGALEVRSSRLSAAIYRTYQTARAAAGKKPSSLEPNFTMKVEDLVKVFLSVHLNDKPQAYVQVFFDDVHAIGFAEMLEFIAAVPKLRVVKHARSDKTTIMIPVSNGRKVGTVVEEPSFVVVHNTLRSGRHDIFARPQGGKLTVDVDLILSSFE